MNIGFDADQDCTAIAATARERGASWVGRYISKAEGGLTVDEARAFAAAGMRIVPIWETTAKRALGGLQAGVDDGRAARSAIAKLGMDHGAVCFTADFDDEQDGSQEPIIRQYFQGCRIGLAAMLTEPVIKTMVYANGAICAATAETGIADYTFLAGGMGMRGSLDFARSGKATIIQGVNDGFGPHWQPEGGWKPLNLGIDLDADVALVDDYGGWLPPPGPPPGPPPRPPPVPAAAVRALQAALGGDKPGCWAAISEAAWQAWRATH